MESACPSRCSGSRARLHWGLSQLQGYQSPCSQLEEKKKNKSHCLDVLLVFDINQLSLIPFIDDKSDEISCNNKFTEVPIDWVEMFSWAY